MKKYFALLFTLLITCSMTACNLTTGSSESSETTSLADSIDTNNVIDMKSFGNWEITVHSAEAKKEIVKDSRASYNAKEKYKFVVISATVKNVGTDEDTFLPTTLSNSIVKLVYNENEYLSTRLAASSVDLNLTTLKPSDSKTGIIVFKVPEDIADNYEDFELVFTYNDDTCSFLLK